MVSPGRRVEEKFFCETKEVFAGVCNLRIYLNEVKGTPIHWGRRYYLPPLKTYICKNLLQVVRRRGQEHWSLDDEVEDALEDVVWEIGDVGLN